MPKLSSRYIKIRRKKYGRKATVSNKRMKFSSSKRSSTVRSKVNVKAGLGFPKRIQMTHKYVEGISLTSTAGVISKYNWSCNGMFDPNTTGTGHQPLYFDQMSALYNHYTVIGSKIKIVCTSGTVNAAPFFIGAFLDDDASSTNITDISGLAEQSTGSYRMLAPGATQTIVFNKKWSAKKTFGGSVLANDSLQGTSSTNPLEQTHYLIALQGANASSPSANFQVEIEYIAIWDELKDMAQS
ncbi:MAG: capsid protein [Cressdnaviricota sp.]|nr:MAG: capsid protein [Cressdnaviricota sp.]